MSKNSCPVKTAETRMKALLLIVMFGFAALTSSGIGTYDELISATIQACNAPQTLLTTSFTNEVMGYRASCADAQGQCAADLALAISLMHRMDHDEACASDDAIFQEHQRLVSGVTQCVGLPAGSWIRYAAAAEYMTGLNDGNRQEDSFALSTNMVARIAVNPPDMGVTNFWAAMSNWMKSPNETMETVFRLNAAIWLAEHNRMAEIVSLTNSLPSSAIGIFLDEIK